LRPAMVFVSSSGGNGAVLIVSKRQFAIRENHALNRHAQARLRNFIYATPARNRNELEQNRLE